MRNIYYMIWSDAIISFKKHQPDRTNWKFTLFVYITWIHALNWWIIFIWLKYFDVLNIPLITIDVFISDMINKFVAFTIMFALPFGVLNYFLVFYNNRYEKIIQKYRDVKLRYAPIYSFTIAILAFVTAILYGILT
ncbi:hypothetical protein BZG01_10175 [Labilibaculum manganireducens]|uniref:Uncharacterized protein n=1 Tax=Labilibaculum manganireducens TaxID=1940525 RepID=A0A2N3I8J8_9BACT|nr:hypothetical protein BZG01_10175 [Labilibaculum manganireducens]